MAVNRPGLSTQDPVIATQDRIVHNDDLGIDQKVFAGQPVPVELVDAYQAAGGELAGSDRASASDAEPYDYDAQTADDLQAIADRLDLTVEGTGKDGNVLKADLVKALSTAYPNGPDA